MLVERPLDASQNRIWSVLIGISWVGLTLGVVLGIVNYQASLQSLGAAITAGVWVLLLTVIPRSALDRSVVVDALSLSGVFLTMVSLTLTGGTDSAYLVLSLVPTIIASVRRGARSGLATALLTAALLIAVELSNDEPQVRVATLGIAVLYLVIAVTVSQIRRLLLDVSRTADELARTSGPAFRRLADLEHANQLLIQLSELTSEPGGNPVSIGRAALQALTARHPDSAFTAILHGDQGPIIVAKAGTTPNDPYEHVIPLDVGERKVGEVRMLAPERLDEEDLTGLATGLRPLALVFSNALLLQNIAGSAVREERVRVARELHDEIGPSLASLGLALDVALLQGVEQNDLATHLHDLRTRVGEMVEEVRTTVSDLRAPRAGAIRQFVDQVVSEIGAVDVNVDVDVDERRPVRPSMADAVYGVVGEALRNAIEHAPGTTVTIRGWVDFDRGRLVVDDQGAGFDPQVTYDGHYGLVGMRERAAAAKAHLDIDSGPDGTRVAVEWGS